MIGLRELKAGDAPGVRRIYSGPSLRFLGRGPMGADEATAYIAEATARSADRPRLRYTLGVDVEGELVAIIKLNVINGEGHLSYIVRHDTWGRSIATCAVTELLAFAFDALSLSTVRAKHRVGNRASGRVLLKSGFTQTGTAGGFAHYGKVRRQVPAPSDAVHVRDGAPVTGRPHGGFAMLAT
ncbi:GNAT family N-acetyltransferase [Streptomyces sp. NBC_01506]|uniref:GNAT family N-acetyltransferase n=1 Tax=Streptomyces sp. NBC_01506 TaxID=2903887 RepID=UPI003864BDEE